MAPFRVHFSLAGLIGIERRDDIIEADNPDAAARVINARYRGRHVAIGKIKRARYIVPDAGHPYGNEHPAVPMDFGK